MYRIALPEYWPGQVGFQSPGPCSNHCIGYLLNQVSNLNWNNHIKHYLWVLPYISVIYYISRNTSKHWDPKVRGYYILDRGQKEITAIHRSWLPHRACGINCLLKYVKQNQSLFFGKNKNTPFYIRPTTLIWASTDRHMTNSFPTMDLPTEYWF